MKNDRALTPYLTLAGAIVLTAITCGAMNLIADLLYHWLDPRVREAER